MELKLLHGSKCRSFCPHPHRLLVAPSHVVTSKHVSFQRRAFSEVVVDDGFDCLPNPNTPWLKLRPEKDKSGGVLECFYNPLENQVVRLNRQNCLGVPNTSLCFTAVRDWLAYVDPKDDYPIYLTNPFRKDTCVISLPPLSTIPTVSDVEYDPKTRRTLKFKTPDVTSELHELDMDPRYVSCHTKMAMMLTDLSLSGHDPSWEDSAVLAIQGDIRRLAYSPISHDAKRSLRWIGLQENYHHNLNEDVVFSGAKRLFFLKDGRGIKAYEPDAKRMSFAIDGCGIQAYDLQRHFKKRSKLVFQFPNKEVYRQLKEFEQDEPQELKDAEDMFPERHHHLVSLDDGYPVLVIRHAFTNGWDLEVELEKVELGDWDAVDAICSKLRLKTVHFDVFRVNFPMQRLERLTTLGERSIFLGCKQSSSVVAHKYPGLKGNSIYFTNDPEGPQLYDDCGIFNLDNNTIHPISYPYTPANLHPNVEAKKSSSWWRALFWVAPPKSV